MPISSSTLLAKKTANGAYTECRPHHVKKSKSKINSIRREIVSDSYRWFISWAKQNFA